MKYITYTHPSNHELIITTSDNEHQTIQEYFKHGGRNITNYEREEHNSPALVISTNWKVRV